MSDKCSLRAISPPIVSFFDYTRRLVEENYTHEIRWCQEVKWEDQTAITFIEQYVWCVLCAAFKEQAARVVEKQFWHNIEVKAPDPFSAIKHPNKRKAIATVMKDTSEHFENLQRSSDKIAYIETLPYMGPALSRQLARNLGLDCVKPDRWLTRLAERWGYKTPLEMCQEIQRWRPELRIGTIDVILWRYCNLTGKVE